MCAQQLDGRYMCFANEVKRPGQQHRHGTGVGHGTCAVFAQPFEVVATQGAITSRQCCALAVAELLGVQLHGQAQGLRGVLKGGMCDVIITDEQTASTILAMDTP